MTLKVALSTLLILFTASCTWADALTKERDRRQAISRLNAELDKLCQKPQKGLLNLDSGTARAPAQGPAVHSGVK